MNAPERVRAFLTAHSKELGDYGGPIISTAGVEVLTEADLEACLQTIDILARLLAAYCDGSPETVLTVAEYLRHMKEIQT